MASRAGDLDCCLGVHFKLPLSRVFIDKLYCLVRVLSCHQIFNAVKFWFGLFMADWNGWELGILSGFSCVKEVFKKVSAKNEFLGGLLLSSGGSRMEMVCVHF